MSIHLLSQTTAPAGSVTISYATIAFLVTAIIVGVGAAVKTAAWFFPAIDKFFGNKDHAKETALAHRYANTFLEASENRPLVLHAVIKEVPAEMVMRVSTAEASIARLEAAHLRNETRQGEQYEKIMSGLGDLREALAGQGFRVDHPRKARDP